MQGSASSEKAFFLMGSVLACSVGVFEIADDHGAPSFEKNCSAVVSTFPGSFLGASLACARHSVVE